MVLCQVTGKSHSLSYFQEGIRSLVTSFSPVSLTSVVYKQTEHVIASYLKQVWDKNDWLYEGQHGFRPRFSCEILLMTVCQDTSDPLDKGDRIYTIKVNISKAFDLVPHGQLITKLQIRVWILG